LMGEEDQWLSDPRFADDIKRGDNGPVISERMARWCAERTTREAVDTLGGAMIPAGPVLSPQQALDHPHIRATGFMQDVDYPGLPIPHRSYELPSGCRKRQVKSWRVRRCLASIPILCWPNSAMTGRRLRRFDKVASFSGYAQ
jgi:crotonobetainyl-CoA:carnitine CoA-transferase CaiB-like acyl-CoA transferase